MAVAATGLAMVLKYADPVVLNEDGSIIASSAARAITNPTSGRSHKYSCRLWAGESRIDRYDVFAFQKVKPSQREHGWAS
jgi:hypothetical protein